MKCQVAQRTCSERWIKVFILQSLRCSEELVRALTCSSNFGIAGSNAERGEGKVRIQHV